jgi:acyl-CoA synthetase (AMP-forming)/AMP-acid ligase II
MPIAEGDFAQAGLLERLLGWAARQPEAPALLLGAHSLSYGELANLVAAVAQALAARGVVPGDRVLLQAVPGAGFVGALYGCWWLGACAVPFGASVPPGQLQRLRVATGASWVLTADDLASLAQAPTRQGAPMPLPGMDRWALMLHTSGSQGRPKVVVLSHGNLAFTAQAVNRHLGLLPQDRLAAVLPLHHTYGLYQVLQALAAGSSAALLQGVTLAAALERQLIACQATVLALTPGLLSQLLALRQPQPPGINGLRVVTCASDALPVPQVLQWRQRWPQVDLCPMYGLTECGRVSMLEPALVDAYPHSVGLPLAGTRAWLLAQDGRRLDGPGRGQLVVSGPHVMQGYWDAAAGQLQALAREDNGWGILLTGDHFRRDADGRLFFEARDTEIIKCRGEKVSARELEAVLMQAPAVREAAVVGPPDPRLGQRIVAHVVSAQPQPDAGALLAFCRQQLEPSHCPQTIQFWPQLPRTELGKVDKAWLLHSLAPEIDRKG